MTTGLLMALAGFGVVNVAMVWYFLTINKEEVPVSIALFNGVLVLGAGVSITGAVLAPGIITGVFSGMSTFFAAFLLYLLSIRRLPEGNLAAVVGEAMPAFVGLNERGETFDLSSLQGQRVMVKFFRGSW